MAGFFKKYPALIFFIGAGILLTVIFVFYEVLYNRQNRMQQKAYEELNQSAWITETDTAGNEENDEEEQARKEERAKLKAFLEEGDNDAKYRKIFFSHPNFESYLEINQDVVGYILIPDTKIDYPVLWNETEDNYYLKRNIDGSTGYPGCIYVQNINANDFSDSVTILYGHNMMDGTMFGQLGSLYRKQDFREEHPYIFLYKKDAVCVYELVAATTYSDDHLFAPYFEKDGEDNFFFTELPENAASDTYERMKEYGDKNAYFKENAEIGDRDKLIILSTCYGDRRRFVVTGRLLFSKAF